MSFATDAKIEVLFQNIDNTCCAMAFLSGLIKSAGQLGMSSNGMVVEIYTDLEQLYDKVAAITTQIYGITPEKEYVEAGMGKPQRIKIVFPTNIAQELLLNLGVLTIEDGCHVIQDGIEWSLVEEDCCKNSYIKGAFVGCATSNIVIKSYDNMKKNTSGYHLEFVFAYENLAKDFIQLLQQKNIPAKMTMRKSSPIVYIKEYQVICDILALVGASKAVLQLQNEAAIRELRNTVNRQNNCFSANLSKTVTASVKQLEAIELIKNTIGIDALSQPLSELCLIRLANPDQPLDKLKDLYYEPVTKSGINHRFQKILKIAESIKNGTYKG